MGSNDDSNAVPAEAAEVQAANAIDAPNDPTTETNGTLPHLNGVPHDKQPEATMEESTLGHETSESQTVEDANGGAKSPASPLQSTSPTTKPEALQDDDSDVSDFESKLSRDMRYDVGIDLMETAKPGSRLRSRQAMSYFLTVEARIKGLEDDIETLRASMKANDAATKEDVEKSGTADGDKVGTDEIAEPEIERWSLVPDWLPVRLFVEQSRRKSLPEPILEVLIEPMAYDLPPLAKGKWKRHQPETAAQPTPQKQDKYEVHRIRINSPYICKAFARVMDKSKAPKTGETHIRPFKAILAYHADLCKHLSELEDRIKVMTELGQLDGSGDKSHDGELEKDGAESVADGSLVDDPGNEPIDDKNDHIVETRDHLQAFLAFAEEHLKTELASYQKFRSPDPSEGIPKVAFADLWKLYAPGEIVFSPTTRQASRIISVRGGRKSLRYRDSSDDRSGAGEGVVSGFVITCFHLDFDGALFGPVQFEIQIEPYDGTRSVLKLPAHPIAYLEHSDGVPSELPQDPTARSRQDAITELGLEFCNLANAATMAHKDYDGLSADPAPEHIDSEIIVDLEKFYQLYRDRRPTLGFADAEEADPRESAEVWSEPCPCGDSSCSLTLEAKSTLYDDRKVDQEMKDRAFSEVSAIARYRSGNEDVLRTEHAILFPSRIQAFVLKSREWHALDINNISKIESDGQNFKDLILQPGHKEIVMSLVDQHSGGPKHVEGLTAPNGQRSAHVREDLVRGKGKGLIILLHGVPGVGKTSTAECVAEYTKRPLYALTCGDIGETPALVQSNLQKAFTLAYRWSCVLLLDEADVFLAERGRTDMNRNAVVSVFLRTLEYYSGILFLTTNKVGVFDEAFKSRIHVSLYYKPLDLEQTIKIWQVNLKRIKDLKPELKFNTDKILDWVEDSWNAVPDHERNQWNGRQIHNAVRTAAALAQFRQEDGNRVKIKHFEQVEKASKEFDDYLEETRGQDELAIAHTNQDRADPRKADLYEQRPVNSKLARSRASNDGYDRQLGGVNLASMPKSRSGTAQPPARSGRRSRKNVVDDDEVDEDDEEENHTGRRQSRTKGGAARDEDEDDDD